jgi:tetratricopeptide (TPR) repeat protein
MPEPQEITAVNPTTGKRVRFDGKTWVPVVEAEGSFTKVGRGATMGALSGAGVAETETPVQDTLKGLIESIGTMMGSGTWTGKKTAADVLRATPPVALARGGYGALKEIYGGGKHGGVNPDIEELSHGLSSLTAQMAMLGMGGKAATTPLAESELIRGVKGGTSGALREVLGVPERAIERARAEHATKMAKVQLKNLQDHNTAIADYNKAMREAEAEHQKAVNETEGRNLQKEAAHKLKVEQIKEAHAAKLARDAEAYRNKVAELQRQHEQEISAFGRPGAETESGKATAAAVRRKTLTTAAPRGGPVYQRLAGMADRIAEGVPKLQKAVRTTYDARWGAWRQAMGDTEGNFTPVQAAVEEAEDSILKGSAENIAIFRNILREGEDPILAQAGVFKGGRGLDVKDIMGSRYMSEATKNRVLQSLEESGVEPETGRMPLGDVNLPIDDIRGYVTELQQKMYGGKFPSGDIWKALEHVKKAGEAEIERAIKVKNPEQLPVYNKLKSDWSQFLGDFYDREGALAKLGNSVNSDTRINLLKGAEGARVIDAMGRYAKFNPDIQSVGRLRSLVKQITELPATGAGPTEPVIPPRPPARPEPIIPPPPTPKPRPEFKPPEGPKFKEPGDVVPFDVPKFVKDKVEKQAERIGIAGHTLLGYWILRDIFHGELPSPSLIAVPAVQSIIRKYLASPRFLDRITKMVTKEEVQRVTAPTSARRPPTPYRPSEKAATMAAPRKSLGSEFEQGEVAHEIQRNRAILRNPRATPEDRLVARQRLYELEAEP